MENKNYKAFIVPMVAVAIFTLVIFGAGYAFFAATVNTTAIANISTQLPDSGTTFVVDSDACSITVNAADMVQAQAGTYNGTSTCHLNVTLTGAAGVSCNYNVMLVQKGTSKSDDILKNQEGQELSSRQRPYMQDTNDTRHKVVVIF